MKNASNWLQQNYKMLKIMPGHKNQQNSPPCARPASHSPHHRFVFAYAFLHESPLSSGTVALIPINIVVFPPMLLLLPPPPSFGRRSPPSMCFVLRLLLFNFNISSTRYKKILLPSHTSIRVMSPPIAFPSIASASHTDRPANTNIYIQSHHDD